MQLGLDPLAYWRCEDEAERAFLSAVVRTNLRQREQAQQLAELKARSRELNAS